MKGGGTNILNIAIHVRVKSPETYREMYVRVGEMCVLFLSNSKSYAMYICFEVLSVIYLYYLTLGKETHKVSKRDR